ncbi:MAG TPA: hypothetical protein VNE39_04685 [Planctomycetota bacterium]|nr:hypothetical protein [Planctomycetota bacterium]
MGDGTEGGSGKGRSGLTWAVGGGIVAAFCGLVLWGLEWGVPSATRARLEGAAKLKARLPEMVGSGRLWETRPTHGVEPKPPAGVGAVEWERIRRRRDVFNPLRSYHPDEYQVFKSLADMRPGLLDFDPRSYIYPALHTYLVGAVEGLCGLLGAVRLERDVAFYYDHPGEMGRLYLVGRALSLLAAVGALLLVCRAGAKMGGATGLLAMGLLAAMPALGIHAHNLTRDTCMALAAALLFLACRKLNEAGTARWYDAAGAAAGLCVAFQFFAVVLWVLIPLTALLRVRREEDTWGEAATGVGVSFIMMIAVFGLTSPYHLLRADQFIQHFQAETGHVSGGLFARLVSLGWATHLPRMLPALVTWPLAVVVAVGVVWALVRRRDDDWLLLAWLVVWAVVVGVDGRAYSRYYVGLLPCLALLGARGLMATWDALRRLVKPMQLRAAVAAVVLLVGVGPAAVVSWGWARLYATENVRTLAGEWIAAHVPGDAVVAVTEWPWQYDMPPLDVEGRLQGGGGRRLVVLADGGPPYDAIRLLKTPHDFFVTSSLQLGRIPPVEGAVDERSRFWRALLASGEYRVRRFIVAGPPLTGPMAALPEDMQYVNPEIYVLERKEREAVAAAWGGSP